MVRIWLLFMILILGCSDSAVPDTTPPGQVQDLMVAVVTDTTVTLAWTAPGDGGDEGQAASYDLRYSRGPLPAQWESAVRVEGVAPPQAAGTQESATVPGLEVGTTYSFALQTADEAGNTSALSNVVQGQTGDTVPPSAIVDLAILNVNARSIELEFTAPGDDGAMGTAASYEGRYSESALTEESWPQAAAFPLAPPQAPGTMETAVVGGLTPERTYYVGVRARDDGGLLGSLGNSVMTTLPADTVPPVAVDDLSVESVGFGIVTLTWTSPESDGEERPAAYHLRYQTSELTEAQWVGATVVEGEPVPSASGKPERMTVRELPEGVDLWCGLKSSDGAGNESGISNVVVAQALGRGRTWEVRVDGSGDAPAIQAAIDSSTHGDRVLVHPGTYFEHIDLLGKRVHLESAKGPQVTILDGSGETGSVVSIVSGETRETILEGFTIQGGDATFLKDFVLAAGGGILCLDSSPCILGNIIRDNESGFPERGFGGGVLVDGARNTLSAQPMIEGNLFEANRASVNGGGLMVGDAVTEVRGNTFLRNETSFDGGGVYVAMGDPGTVSFVGNRFVENVAGDHGGAIEAGQADNESPAMRIENNVFVRNEAHGNDLPTDSGTGGALSMRDWPARIVRNTFVGNIGTGGASCTGGHILVDAPHEILIEKNVFVEAQGCAMVCRSPVHGTLARENLFWENDGDIGNPGTCFPEWEGGDLFTDPLFCDPDNDDYRLQPGSPALEAGMGAFLEPGCSGSAPVTSRSPWGTHRSRY